MDRRSKIGRSKSLGRTTSKSRSKISRSRVTSSKVKSTAKVKSTPKTQTESTSIDHRDLKGTNTQQDLITILTQKLSITPNDAQKLLSLSKEFKKCKKLKSIPENQFNSITQESLSIHNKTFEKKVDKLKRLSPNKLLDALNDPKKQSAAAAALVDLYLQTPLSKIEHPIFLFQSIPASDLAKHSNAIESAFNSRIDNLDPKAAEISKKRFSHFKDMASYANTLTADNWNSSKINQLVLHRLDLRRFGITSRFSEQLTSYTQENHKIEDGILVDENGKKFDTMRGKNSIINDLAKFMQDNDGDFKIISLWAGNQKFDSWSSIAQGVKFNMLKYRNTKADSYFFLSGLPKAEQCYNKLLKTIVLKKLAPDSESAAKLLDQTWDMWLAFNMEFHSHTQVPGFDPSTNTIKVFRTENKTVMHDINKMNVGDSKVIKRGVAESSAIALKGVDTQSAAPIVYGTELTVQYIPLHRIFATYICSDKPDSNDSAFVAKERELVFMSEGLIVEYLATLEGGKAYVPSVT